MRALRREEALATAEAAAEAPRGAGAGEGGGGGEGGLLHVAEQRQSPAEQHHGPLPLLALPARADPRRWRRPVGGGGG